MTTDTDTNVVVDSSVKVVMKVPKMFNVVLFNDNSTTVEFVILILTRIFYKSFEEAQEITLFIHNNGSGVAGTYSHEVATQKRNETIKIARANNFPLRCEIDEA